jgi:hypothetical protein
MKFFICFLVFAASAKPKIDSGNNHEGRMLAEGIVALKSRYKSELAKTEFGKLLVPDNFSCVEGTKGRFDCNTKSLGPCISCPGGGRECSAAGFVGHSDRPAGQMTDLASLYFHIACD